MAGTSIETKADFMECLGQIWTCQVGLDASQDLHEGVTLEQFYEEDFKVYGVKTRDGWNLTDKKPSTSPVMRLFYYGDFSEKLCPGTLEEFATQLQDLLDQRQLVFIPLRTPEFLIEVGFDGFAKRLGLPGK